MFRITTNARTAWVGDLVVENKVGNDLKPYVAKSILLKVASNRDYQVTKVANGVTTKERPSDFILCKATGSLAQLIADHASEKNNGKIVSRFLELAGHLEVYTSTKTVPVEKVVTIGEKKYNIKFEAQVPVENTIFIIKELQFLDNIGTKAKVVEATGSSDMVITEVSDAPDSSTSTPITTIEAPPVNVPAQGQGQEVIGSIEPPAADANGDVCPF